jgi:integrase
MPVYKGRRAGTWRVTIWAQGRQHESIVEGKKSEAEAFEARERVKLEATGPSVRTAPTFSAFCVEVYRPHAVEHLKASTWQKVRVYQLATLCDFFGAKKLSELTVADVEAYKRARLATKKAQASSVNNELRVFRTVLNYARSLGYPVAPLTFRKLPVRGKGRVRVWSAEQVGRLFDAARVEAPELLPVLVFLINTGCRKGEAIAAEWSWVDLPGGLLRIPSNDAWQPKNGMPREVPLSNAVRAILAGERRHERWLFPSRLGGRYLDFPKDLFARVRTLAKLEGGPHTTRHTFASHFLAACPDLFLLSRVLGHSHGRITELYSHLLPDHLSRARNAVDIGPAISLAETLATPGKTGGKRAQR